MTDIVQDPNGQRMSVRRFRCVHCAHDFTADVCWGVIETAYKGQCPNCGTLNDPPYCLTSLKNVDASAPIGDKVRLVFSLANMEGLVDKIVKKRGGTCSLNVGCKDSEDGSTTGVKFYLCIETKETKVNHVYDSWNDLVDDWDV